MHQPPADGPRDRGSRLESWKQIAAYLGRSTTTVQRWEEEEGLPVHRLSHAKKGSVFAFTGEIDAWQLSRTISPERQTNTDTPSIPTDLAPKSGIAEPRSAARALLALVSMVAVMLTWLAWGQRARVLPEPALEPRIVVGEPTHEAMPSLSPDGKWIAYAWELGTFGVHIKPLDGGPPRRLTDIVPSSFPSWSPRGDLVAFLGREPNRRFALYVTPAAGGTARKLTVIAGIGHCWHPDGHVIAFADRNSDGEPFSIFSIDIRTSARRRLTTPPLGIFGDTHCAFSPNGRTLAVGRFANRAQSDVFVLAPPESKSSTPRRLTTNFVGVEGLVWAPNGRELVVGSRIGLWRVRADSPTEQKPQLLASRGQSAAFPSFSRPRDGRATSLAYESNELDVNIWAWRNGIDGQRNVTRDHRSWDDHPALSPDGRRIAFASVRSGHNEIWVADLHGGHPRQVTFHEGPIVISPRWSPDGQYIAFTSQLAGNRDIYVIRTDGSESRRITSEPSQEDNPSWSGDGKWIYFRSDRSGIGRIWRAPFGGGAAVAVTSGEASQGIESADGGTLFFVRSETSAGLWSVPAGGGNEAFLVADVREGWWDVAADGVVFKRPPASESSEDAEICLYDPMSGTTARILTIAGGKEQFPGFSVARDRSVIVWTQAEPHQSDIMLIAPWH